MTGSEGSTLRERQAQQVAGEIRSQFAKLVVDRGPNGFTLADVAAAAGISERTLYRYYPNREAIIDAFREIDVARFNEILAARGGTRENWNDPDTVARTFEVFEEHAELVQATSQLRSADIDNAEPYQRTEDVREFLSSYVSPEALDQVVALVRTLAGSDGWMRMREPDLGLDARTAGHAVQWAINLIVAAARDLDGPLTPEDPPA